jgi:hypothetical protein
VGFEPTVGCPTHAFQACAFDRSAISPNAVCRTRRLAAFRLANDLASFAAARACGSSALRRSDRGAAPVGKTTGGRLPRLGARRYPRPSFAGSSCRRSVRAGTARAGGTSAPRAARPSTPIASGSGSLLGDPSWPVPSSARAPDHPWRPPCRSVVAPIPLSSASIPAPCPRLRDRPPLSLGVHRCPAPVDRAAIELHS